ncbi:Sterol-4-alpha-carboxylate 3-dehydrogenase, decarboxylating [Diplodia seriata]|uniref:Sterol-4-alpha-carboxylate 3-dehydrogenase, decarboxylating n=1 Tax=Diplodia seriata TaxID=420778 RepID=A0A1S8B5B0_9PEZI|nr:Sterol-4-alpha-carboxylate 3-dehydrogenase, decarboxylating [Diplodia seriata]
MAPPEYESFGSVLVTGGCGFVGHHVVAGLLRAQPQCAVAAIDISISNTLPGASYHRVDITDSSALHTFLRSLDPPPRVVIHTACAPILTREHDVLWSVNLNGTRNLLDAARDVGTVRAFVHCSSSSVVHDNRTHLVEADEDLPVLKAPAQKRVYTLTKAFAEEAVLQANRSTGSSSTATMLTVAIRPCTLFGPGNDLFITKIIDVVESGRARLQLGEGTNPWDFCYIDNLVHALFLAASALLRVDTTAPPLPSDRRVEGEPINVTNLERLPFWGFTLAVADALGKPVPPHDLVRIPLWIGLIMGFVAEWGVWLLSLGRREAGMSVETVGYTYLIRTLKCDKARERLAYKPLVGLHEGIRRTMKEYRNSKERKEK